MKEKDEEYILNRVDDQIASLTKKAKRNRRIFNLLLAFEAIAPVSILVLDLFIKGNHVWEIEVFIALYTLIFSAIFFRVGEYLETSIDYQHEAQTLIREKFLYQSGKEEYATEKSLVAFQKKIDEIIRSSRLNARTSPDILLHLVEGIHSHNVFRMVHEEDMFQGEQEKNIVSVRESDNPSQVSKEIEDLEIKISLKAADEATENTEKVFLGASAPDAVNPGVEFTARFFAYIDSAREETVSKIEKMSPLSQINTDIKTCFWKKGLKVTVVLSGEGISVDEPVQDFVWGGYSEIVDFDVKVTDATKSFVTLKYDILIGEFRIAKIRIDVKTDAGQTVQINNKPGSKINTKKDVAPIRTAFASYASEDRDIVLHRVAEITRDGGVDMFMDCLSLHPGEEWKPKLEDEILKREAFFLFWSINAKNSKWVEWEWRCAFYNKAGDAIEPHPLEGPDVATPPPPELAKFHFSDPILAGLRMKPRADRSL